MVSKTIQFHIDYKIIELHLNPVLVIYEYIADYGNGRFINGIQRFLKNNSF